MKKNTVQKSIAYIVIAAILGMIAFPAFASITGFVNITNHDLTLNNLANYNIIQCERTLIVASSYVKGTSNLSWYTFSGNATQLAYCNAVTGTLTVSVNAIASNYETMVPRSTTVNLLGQKLSSGIVCSANRNHNLDLIAAEAVTTVVIRTPDGDLMTTYQKILPLQ